MFYISIVFRRSKGVTFCISIAFSPMQRRYFLHQHSILAEAKALSSAPASHFHQRKGVTFYINRISPKQRRYVLHQHCVSPKQRRYFLHQHSILADAKVLYFTSIQALYFRRSKGVISCISIAFPPTQRRYL
ncbi:hypothetical protein HAX54_000675 [Datura stramonium]|uniref:Uncharacterized protein n=1 Tax=Datura stramonium TaxID=4076 RepID=A0ABS8T208_DATST|nr:hypothetical protein [Datura stramonium]